MEISGSRTDEPELVEAGVRLLPAISRALFAAISHLGHAYHLTPAQVKVLLQLGDRRQMTVGEIANALACSMPAASEIVDRLVDAGHLTRTTDSADRRRVLITAAPESERIGVQLHAIREGQIRYALDQLAPEERPVFIKSLQALVAGLTDVGTGAVSTRHRTNSNSNSAAQPSLTPGPAGRASTGND